jgi:GT2 family glycosyltransferase
VKDPRTSVVVLTHNRPRELTRTLHRLTALPEQPPIIVVDNASDARVVPAVLQDFPGVEQVRCERNLGAAGRNLGVARVQTPYVAFCDDDTWWSAGALSRAAALLDGHAQVGLVSARILVGESERTDPTCEQMARSPLDSRGLPGPALISFMAGASIVRCSAYREVGGYEARLFLGAEEALMGLDLAARGHRMVYAGDVVTHHHPSATGRDPTGRRIAERRNRLWIAVMRLPWPDACACWQRFMRESIALGIAGPVLTQALRGLPWALDQRRVVPAEVAAMHRCVHGGSRRAPAGSIAAPERH